jgi:predicted nucleotidyltransferase
MFMSLKHLSKKPLDPLVIESLILTLRDFIRATCNPDRIILFGSAARREMTDMSDLDVIVLFANQDELELARRNYFGQRSPMDYPVDILFMTTADYMHRAGIGGVCFIAETEGRVLYQSEGQE